MERRLSSPISRRARILMVRCQCIDFLRMGDFCEFRRIRLSRFVSFDWRVASLCIAINCRVEVKRDNRTYNGAASEWTLLSRKPLSSRHSNRIANWCPFGKQPIRWISKRFLERQARRRPAASDLAIFGHFLCNCVSCIRVCFLYRETVQKKRSPFGTEETGIDSVIREGFFPSVRSIDANRIASEHVVVSSSNTS